MKLEWLIADVIPVGSPDRAERVILGVILGVYWAIQGVFWSIKAVFVVGEPLCDVGTHSWSLITLSRIVYWRKSGWLPMYVTSVI